MSKKHLQENFVSVEVYAGLCGVKRATIYKRIEMGHIKPYKRTGGIYIDIRSYPPIKVLKLGRKPLKPFI